MTLKDMANQLLLPILGNVDPSGMELSPEEEAMEDKLKKRMSGIAKLSHWVWAFSKASDAVHRVAFIAFWLCKFIFGSHPHSTRVSLPLAPMFLGHLYVQLDIL